MSRYGKILALTVVCGLTLAGCAPAGVEDEIAALSERVETLESQIQTLQKSAGPSANLEQEAQASIAALQQMVAVGNLDQAKAKLKSDAPKYASTRVGGRFQTMSRELAVVGKDCPSEWGIEKWFQGENAIDLASNAPTVLVFWESWCPHCRREMPKLQQTYDKFKGDGLQLIGLTRINRSATEEAVQDLIDQNQIKYPIAKEDGSVANYFAVSGIPAAAVVKNGKVVWRGHPRHISDTMLKDWLAS